MSSRRSSLPKKHICPPVFWAYATGAVTGLLASSSMSVGRLSLLHPLPPCSMTSWPHAPEMSCRSSRAGSPETRPECFTQLPYMYMYLIARPG